MIRQSAPTLIALFVAACGAHSAQQYQPQAKAPPAELTPTKINATQKTAIERGIRGRLRDPESARFGRAVSGYDETGLIYTCGVVNAKNAYGGYTGEKPYMVVLLPGPKATVGAVHLGDQPAAEGAVFEVCQTRGLFL